MKQNASHRLVPGGGIQRRVVIRRRVETKPMSNRERFNQTGADSERPAAPPGDRRLRCERRGYTLIEMLVCLIVTGVLLSMGVPLFQQSLEQSRADVAGASLRAIWSAQRLYWLQNRTYAPDLPTLLAASLIGPSLNTVTTPFTYSIASASDTWFTATATRVGSTNWSGSFTIAADGTTSGAVQQSGTTTISIIPRFQ
jgi:prepilin-type N-terminal cleavage/methylation domain-containing protein